MFNLKAVFLSSFFKFTVVSDIPGRLRLKVNNYKKIPKESFVYDAYVKDAISMLQGVDSVSFNHVIGTVIVEYDRTKLSSKDIMDWVNSVKNLAIKNIDIINKMSDLEEDEIIKRLFDILKIHYSEYILRKK